MKKVLGLEHDMSVRAVIYLVCQILAQGIGFILAPVYTHLLSPNDYGISSVFITSISFFSIIIGLQTHGSLNNAKMDFPEEKQLSYNSSILSISFCFFLFALSLSILFNQALSKLLNMSPFLVVLLVITSFGSFCVQFLSSYFTVNKKSFVYLILSVLIAVLIAVFSLSFILLAENNRYMGKIAGYSLVYIVFGFGIYIAILAKGKTFYNKKYWSFCLSLTIPLILHAVAGQILAQSDRLMLNSMVGSSVAGIYSFCYTVALPINSVWFALNSTWVPQYYEHMKNNNETVIHKQSLNYLFVFTCLTVGFLLVSPEGVKILAPESYWSGILIVPIVVLSCYFSFLYSFPANYEFFHKKTGWISLASVSAAALNIVLNLILIPIWGMMGAALATLFSYLLLFFVHEFVARCVIKGYTYRIQFYLKGLIPVFVVTILTYMLIDFWILRWMIATVVGVALLYKIIQNKGIF